MAKHHKHNHPRKVGTHESLLHFGQSSNLFMFYLPSIKILFFKTLETSPLCRYLILICCKLGGINRMYMRFEGKTLAIEYTQVYNPVLVGFEPILIQTMSPGCGLSNGIRFVLN